ncbi:Uncharacterized protein YyaL [hydrothermal vent metagenome]|uniref:Uncharacterized protein YyaL n=1 Tax=hydrothermal vent metagenome TaxID=652676 RepID=A0A3B0XZR8_9ZZZZ
MKIFNFLLLIFFLMTQAVKAENITVNHPSPYVRMHANDAVKWQKWDASVLERAQKENKLIMISSGYYACHWCHVMRKQSYTDAEVAAVLNNKYIVVKIDRELNSSLDAYLMDFLQRTTGHGGWPLNVFLTPWGYPLTGLVYLPKKQFMEVILKLETRWKKDPAGLTELALNSFRQAEKLNTEDVYISNKGLLGLFLNTLNQSMDEMEGGFGNGVKFPMPYLMMSLLSVYEKNKDKALSAFIRLTLKQMSEKGLHDVIGGGFFRYTVDQSWSIPHFEKMLYGNAAMIGLYVKAYRVFNDEQWLRIAEETMDFVLREMQSESGFYVSSLNAQDASGEEGGNYLWDRKKLTDIINGSENRNLRKNVTYHAVSGSDKVLPVGLWYGEISDKSRLKLLQKRRANPPVKDDKLVLSWNAYLLSSMVELIKVSDRKQYRQSARQLYKKIKSKASSDIVRNRQGHGQKYLDDYAFITYSLYQWNTLLKTDTDQALILSLVMQSVNLFSDKNGWRMTDDALIPMPASQKNIADANLPSAEVALLKLFYKLGIKQRKVNEIIQRVRRQVDVHVVNNPLEFSSLIILKRQYALD